MTKKKTSSKKRKARAKSKKVKQPQKPFQKEVADAVAELELILSEMRTSTVSFSRQRIEKVINRLKSIGET